jgi:hypothetical protein
MASSFPGGRPRPTRPRGGIIRYGARPRGAPRPSGNTRSRPPRPRPRFRSAVPTQGAHAGASLARLAVRGMGEGSAMAVTGSWQVAVWRPFGTDLPKGVMGPVTGVSETGRRKKGSGSTSAFRGVISSHARESTARWHGTGRRTVAPVDGGPAGTLTWLGSPASSGPPRSRTPPR